MESSLDEVTVVIFHAALLGRTDVIKVLSFEFYVNAAMGPR
jgi:hypothetical protein